MEITIVKKMEKKLQKTCPICYNLLITLKEFIKLNVNSDMMIKNVKHVELNISMVTVFWFCIWF